MTALVCRLLIESTRSVTDSTAVVETINGRSLLWSCQSLSLLIHCCRRPQTRTAPVVTNLERCLADVQFIR